MVYSPPKRTNLVKRSKKKLTSRKRKNDNNISVIQIPRAKSYNVKYKKASITTNSKGTTVKHREFVSQIKSPVTGNNNTDLNSFKLMYAAHVNPGNKSLFPWLSMMSFNYETYKFSALRFIYKPVCNTDTIGTISIAMDYDPDDDYYDNKVQLMSAKDAASGQPWTKVVHNPKTKDINKEKTYYISHRNFNIGAEKSLRLTDCGLFQLGVDSCKGNQLLGELYVEYTIHFETPELNVHEVLNTFSKSSSQKKAISANNDSLLGTIVENQGLIKSLLSQGLTVAKVASGALKGDIIKSILPTVKSLVFNMLSTGTTRPVIKAKVYGKLGEEQFEINNFNSGNLIDETEIYLELLDGDVTNVEELPLNIGILVNHNVSTASQIFQCVVKIPENGYLHIYPNALTYLTDYSIFNITDISIDAFDLLKLNEL